MNQYSWDKGRNRMTSDHEASREQQPKGTSAEGCLINEH